MLAEGVREKLETLPVAPGVYLFRGADEKVLYVGKASNLKSRVRSYFAAGRNDPRAFIDRLEAELSDIETFVAASEKEAALLESELIKRHRPRYNVKLRDDKDYLSLRLDPKEEWPRLRVVRRPHADGARYFGPYPSASGARKALKLINRYFQLRTCTDRELKSRTRPCLQHQIGRCPAPCVLPISPEAYGAQVRGVTLLLSGRHDELSRELGQRMGEASAALEYEEAARLRDQLRAVTLLREEQHVSSVRDVDQDVLGFFRQADQAQVVMLRVREGRLSGVDSHELRRVSLPDEELVAAFLDQHYERAAPPDEVLIPVQVEAAEGLAQVLSERRGRRVTLRIPQRGTGVRLLKLAADNAEHAFHGRRRASEDVESRLEEVWVRLRLPRTPHRIVCVDISHTGGEETVAVFVRLEEGVPARRGYRSFRVRTVSGGDDYGAMREVLLRRLKRGKADEEGWELPDLLVVDGGRGQLAVAISAREEAGVDELPVVGLAKEKENVLGELLVDRVYLPGQKNPITLRSSPALALLALARDEAHRASNALRVKVGKGRRLRSDLDAIPGVGPKTRQRLLSTLGSLKRIAEADLDGLRAAGATQRQAEAIQAHFAADGSHDIPSP